MNYVYIGLFVCIILLQLLILCRKKTPDCLVSIDQIIEYMNGQMSHDDLLKISLRMFKMIVPEKVDAKLWYYFVLWKNTPL